MAGRHQTLVFDKPLSRPDLDRVLSFEMRELEVEHHQVCVLDSVDWRLWYAGQVLIRRGSQQLQLIGNDDSSLTTTANKNQRFAWHFSGSIKERLDKILSVRALVQQFCCDWKTEKLALLNRDEKIVLHLLLHCLSGPDRQPHYLLQTVALRGYEKELAQVEQELAMLKPRDSGTSNIRDLLLRAGLTPTSISTKPQFNLTEEQPAELAVAAICSELLLLARSQEAGLLDDIDSEFTHQYRVNLRKARSLISLFKKAFSSQRYQLLRQQMKEMAQQTNRLRDLDVFLLDHGAYQNMLPDNLHPGLGALFRRIARRRQAERKKVVNSLTDPSYQQRVTQLVQDLKQPAELIARHSAEPIKPLVSRKILVQYRKIQQGGAQVTSATSDEQIHNLRIDAKKLRYLLELFSELFPRKKIRRLIKSLKTLQDNLGRFNDYSSQREFLDGLAREARTPAIQRDAIHGLSAMLFNMQQQERRRVVALIADFSDKPVAGQFLDLFQKPTTKDTHS